MSRSRIERMVVAWLSLGCLSCLWSCGQDGPGIQAADFGYEARDESGRDPSRDYAIVRPEVNLDIDDLPDTIPTQDADVPPAEVSSETDACSPWCGEAECGDNGCGGTCGVCTDGKVCIEGACECIAQAYRSCCGNAVCWFDSCGTQGNWIVDCPKGCEAAGCIDCSPDCEDKACGEDGCGHECGQCTAGTCDGLAWTTPAVCVGGQCMGGGAQQDCDDLNGCTRDHCDPRFGCGHKVREDGYLCQEGICEGLLWSRPLTCVSGACTGGGGAQLCEDDNLCTTDSCFTTTGCLFTPNKKGCDDNDPCTTGDTCQEGLCQGNGILVCDDQNPCTTDSCVKGQGCQHVNVPDGTGCGPSSCNGLIFIPGASCIGGACTGTGGGPKDCDDGKACTLDQCDAEAGCTHDVIDGNCLIEGACQANGAMKGACLRCSAAVDKTHWTVMDACNDGLSCTTDACDPATGACQHDLAAEQCLIAGTCYANGQSGALPCKVCTAARTATDWSAANDGTACGIGGKCYQGSCCVPSCGGKVCGADGCGGTCGTCPADSRCEAGQCVLSDTVCGGVTCPVVSGYNVTCNAQQHCEYANTDTTGWRQWDVWVHVPAGSFTMGSSDAGSESTPAHTVTFAKGYLMGKYEVTAAQYEACQSASPGTCTLPSTTDWNGLSWNTNTSERGRSNHPQNGLTWEQLGAVCTWLGGRRPSEAEWEYAATGPTHRQYPWGDSPTPDCTHAVFDSDGSGSRPWGCDSCTITGCSGTKTVGSMPAGASWSGALDMAGNVWEWVEDWWHSDYSGAPTDGSAWVTPTGALRVLRGGSFIHEGARLRSSYRYYASPSFRYAHFGGRCLRPLP